MRLHWHGTRRSAATSVPVLLSIGWLTLLISLSIVGPCCRSDPNAQDLISMLALRASPLAGRGFLGRHLRRVLYGAQVSLTVGLGSVGIGLLVGAVSGWSLATIADGASRWSGFMNVLLAFPGLILAITIVANLGGSLLNVTLRSGPCSCLR
jgi:ABC-type dipeptide/oligopeptide/nickel transport system permease subunit